VNGHKDYLGTAAPDMQEETKKAGTSQLGEPSGSGDLITESQNSRGWKGPLGVI